MPALTIGRPNTVSEPETRDFRTDAQLFAAINRGDASAFDTLYGKYADWVHALALRFTRNEADALDVLQDAFAYLVRKAPHLRLTAKATTYLYRDEPEAVVRAAVFTRRVQSMIFDPMYLLFIAPALLLSLWASAKTKSSFKKYSRVPAASGLSGAQAAQRLLDGAGIGDVAVRPTRGLLTDHYNPLDKSLNLSEGVYGSRSIAAG